MTGRYKRKSTQGNLEVRGISRGGGSESYHTPLHLDSSDFIPHEFAETVNNAINQYESDEDSDRSSPLTADQYLDASNNVNWTSNLTTGNTTDRTSTYSTATYDDFDKEASQTVQRLFDEIDCMLFEPHESSQSQQLFDECADWNLTFPHLRILGKQLLESLEQGYVTIETPASRPSTSDTDDHVNSSSSFSNSSDSLFIEGNTVRTHSYSTTTPSSTSIHSVHSNLSHLHEEVFDLDGNYEDIIAIDSDNLHEDPMDAKSLAVASRHRRSRYPPITPNACAKDDICNSVFDVVWNMVTASMRILLQRYSEHFVLTHPMVIAAADDVGDHDGSHVKLPQILMPGSTIDSSVLPMSHVHQRFLSNNSIMSRPSPNIISQTPSGSGGDQLGKLLHISKMEMTERRERTFIEEGSVTPVGMMIAQSANLKKTVGQRNASATKKIPARSKLAPLNDRVRTPNVDDEILRGQGIAAVGKRLSSPPMMGSRMLPPINHSDIPHISDTTPPPTRGPLKRSTNRASSAVGDKDGRPIVLREKAVIIADTRPSTTHTVYPADQMTSPLSLGFNANQRSTTPLDRFSNKLLLNITGSSLIGQHAQLEEEVEGRFDPSSQHSQWGTSVRFPHIVNDKGVKPRSAHHSYQLSKSPMGRHFSSSLAHRRASDSTSATHYMHRSMPQLPERTDEIRPSTLPSSGSKQLRVQV